MMPQQIAQSSNMEFVPSGSLTVVNIQISIPPELSWIVHYYEKKAEVRRQLGTKSTMELEILNAAEQYAILGLRNEMDFAKLFDGQSIPEGTP